MAATAECEEHAAGETEQRGDRLDEARLGDKEREDLGGGADEKRGDTHG